MADISLLDHDHATGWLRFIDWHVKNYRQLHPELTRLKHNLLCIDKMVQFGAMDPAQ